MSEYLVIEFLSLFVFALFRRGRTRHTPFIPIFMCSTAQITMKSLRELLINPLSKSWVRIHTGIYNINAIGESSRTVQFNLQLIKFKQGVSLQIYSKRRQFDKRF